MDWWIFAIGIGFWIVGMLAARAQRLPLRRTVVFSAVMLGTTFAELLLQKGMLPRLRWLAEGGLIFPVASLGIAILFIFHKRPSSPVILSFLACALIFSTFILNPGYVATSMIYAVAFFLFISAWIVVIRLKQKPKH